MKNIILFVVAFILFNSCKEKTAVPDKNVEALKYYDDLCLEPVNVVATKDKDFIEEHATIKYETQLHSIPFYYISIKGFENRYFSSCKLPENFKQDGLKVIITGAAYSYNCIPGKPCSDGVITHFLITNIKQL